LRNIARAVRTYELLTILSPDVPEEEIPGALERISGHVTAVGGSVEDSSRDSPWGRRRLAYPIRFAGRDVRDGYYTLFHLSLAPNRVDEMERELKLNTQVMRYLVTSFEPKPLDPRAIEDAEAAAEDAAAAAYAEAQAAAARLAREASAADDAAAAAYAEAEAARLAAANAAQAGDATATATAAATESPVRDTTNAENAPAAEAQSAATEPGEAPQPPPAAVAGVGADQPIQGAAGLAGQPDAGSATLGTGTLMPGVARAEQEAPQAESEAAGDIPDAPGTPSEEA
jgi:small subunit ribosomal protein S6